ncbi:MAG: hypothetical protein AAGN35_14995 [Bacteroidota bacterium]
MGTRNIRIMRSQIAERRDEITGQIAHVVLRNGKTHSGVVIEADAESLTVRDTNARWTSRKRHTHRVPLVEIMEVILDTVTKY